MTIHIEQMLGADAEYLLGYNTRKVSKDLLHLPGPDYIDRVMAIDEERLTLENLKWMILMVLFSQPDEELAFARMEHLVYGNLPAYLH